MLVKKAHLHIDRLAEDGAMLQIATFQVPQRVRIDKNNRTMHSNRTKIQVYLPYTIASIMCTTLETNYRDRLKQAQNKYHAASTWQLSTLYIILKWQLQKKKLTPRVTKQLPHRHYNTKHPQTALDCTANLLNSQITQFINRSHDTRTHWLNLTSNNTFTYRNTYTQMEVYIVHRFFSGIAVLWRSTSKNTNMPSEQFT